MTQPDLDQPQTATPPRTDLRALAVEAIRRLELSTRDYVSDEALAEAVLAAVLPEHRRMVLTEAAVERQKAAELTGWFLTNDHLRKRERATFERGRAAAFAEAAEAIETEAADLGRNGHTAREEAYLAAVEFVRRLAAAAPPAGLSAPVPAENAPAVPEEAAKAQRRPPPPECELPTPGGNWCALTIGHDGPCSPTRRLKSPEEADGQRAGQGDVLGWTVTAWRCACHEWTWTAYFSDLQWFPMNAGLRVYGEQSARTLDDLRSAHPNLTPVAVDDVAALVAERDRLAGELHEAQTELALVKSRPLFSTRKVMQTLLEALGDPVDEQELILRIDDGLRLADVAQRVIAALALTAAERDVIEKAKVWRGNRYVSASILELAAAVDALPDAGTDQTEDDRGE